MLKSNKFSFFLIIVLISMFIVIPIYNNTNLLKDHVVENLESFSEELKTSTCGWTTTEVVSTESTGNCFDPTIAVDGSGNVHIAWADATNYGGLDTDVDIFYKRWNATTAIWTMPTLVSTESTDDSWSPTIAADGSGNVHIAWYDRTNYGSSGTDYDIFYKRWNATTAIWTTTEVVSTESTSNCYYPTIAVDGSGNVHIAWADYTDYSSSGTDSDIFYKCWNATTAAWTTTEVVSTESTDDSSYPTIAMDGSGNVHIAWHDFTDYGGSGTDLDVFYKCWNATTAVWTTTEVISTESTDFSSIPTIAVDGSGNVHIAWQDHTDYGGSGTDLDIFYKRWNPTTAIWTTTEVIFTENNDTCTSLTMAADGSGNAHIVWYDYGGSGTVGGIVYKRWNATTAIWTTTEEVSTESTGNSYNPTIAVDGSGNVHIAWTDTTDYSGSGTDSDIFYKKLISIPFNSSIIINNGDVSTNSTLVTLTLLEDLAVEMCFRNGTTVVWTDWESYATTKQLYIEGSITNMTYSICVKFRNAGGESSPVCDSILYLAEESPPPVAIIIAIIAAIACGGLAVSITTILLIRKRRSKVQ
jgi:ribosomal protein L31